MSEYVSTYVLTGTYGEAIPVCSEKTKEGVQEVIDLRSVPRYAGSDERVYDMYGTSFANPKVLTVDEFLKRVALFIE